MAMQDSLPGKNVSRKKGVTDPESDGQSVRFKVSRDSESASDNGAMRIRSMWMVGSEKRLRVGAGNQAKVRLLTAPMSM